MSEEQKVVRGATYLFIKDILTNGSSIIFFMFIARILPVNDVGVIIALTMIVTFFNYFGTLALPEAASKYISESIGKSDLSTAKGYTIRILSIGLLLSSISAVLSFSLSNWISILLFKTNTYSSLIMLLSLDVFFFVLTNFTRGTARGWQNFSAIAIADTLEYILKFTIALILVIAGMGLVGIVLGWISGDFIGAATYFIIMGTKDYSRVKVPIRHLFAYSIPLYGSLIAEYLTMNVDKFFVLTYLSTGDLGIYGAVVTVVGLASIVYGSMSGVLFPKFSELNASREDKMLSTARKSSKFVALISAPIAFGLAAISYEILIIILGPAYGYGSGALLMISFVLIPVSLTAVVNSLLLAKGFTKELFKSQVLGVLTGTTASLILIPHLQLIGAALSRIILMMSIFSIAAYYAYKKVGVFTDKRGIKKIWSASFGMFLIVIMSKLILLSFITSILISTIIQITIGVVTYIILLRIGKAIQEEDIMVIANMFPSKIKHIFIQIATKILI